MCIIKNHFFDNNTEARTENVIFLQLSDGAVTAVINILRKGT